jgi:hypothetical protein
MPHTLSSIKSDTVPLATAVNVSVSVVFIARKPFHTAVKPTPASAASRASCVTSTSFEITGNDPDDA